MEPWIIVLIVIAAVVVLLFVFAFLCDKMAFGNRCDKNPLLKYFTAEEFGLKAQKVNVADGIKAFIYSKEGVPKNDKLIIFCHGMGPGHIAYMTEIAYFYNHGFTVFAHDNTGCNFSDGKNIKGMYAGVKSAVAAVDYVRKENRFNGKEVYLVGHSWGAYSALCASAERKVEGVIAISAPSSPSKTVADSAAPILSRPFAAILRPFWWLINLFKFGIKGNSNAAKCAEKNQTPTLLIHGDKDNIVKFNNAACFKAEGKNITKQIVKDKAHNPYNTENAEKLLAELSANLMKARKMNEKQREEYFGNFDFTAATEEDEEVMQGIANFIKTN